MKNFLLLLTLIIIFQSQGFSQWSYLGLSGIRINALVLHENNLYAATDNGLYRKPFLSSDSAWSAVGLQSENINDIYIRDSNSIYAGISISEFTNDTTTLFKTNDGGISWNPLWSEFDIDDQSYVEANDIEGISENSDTIILMGNGIRRSTDGGLSFTKVYHVGGRFLTIAQGNQNIMWTGSEGVLLNPYLLQSVDEGSSWTFNDSLSQIVSGDNACLSADIPFINPNVIYVGMEGQIGKSTDNGLHWSHIEMNDYYVKAIKVRSNNPDVVYAAGGTFAPGDSLTLFFSQDGGLLWNQFVTPLATDPDVLEMALKEMNGFDIIYVGTGNHGVFKYVNVTSGIAEEGYANKISIYPNPVTSHAIIDLKNYRNENLSLIICDYQGRIIKEIKNIRTNKVTLEAGVFSDGIYFIQVLKDNAQICSKKFIVAGN